MWRKRGPTYGRNGVILQIYTFPSSLTRTHSSPIRHNSHAFKCLHVTPDSSDVSPAPISRGGAFFSFFFFLQGSTALVLDLRGNSGGVLDGALGIAGMFSETPLVLYVTDANGSKQPLYSREQTLDAEPMQDSVKQDRQAQPARKKARKAPVSTGNMDIRGFLK